MALMRIGRVCSLCTSHLVNRQNRWTCLQTSTRLLTNAASKRGKKTRWSKKRTTQHALYPPSDKVVRPLIVDLLSEETTNELSAKTEKLHDIEGRIQDLEKLLSAGHELESVESAVDDSHSNSSDLQSDTSSEVLSNELKDLPEFDDLDVQEDSGSYFEEIALDIPQKWDALTVTVPDSHDEDIYGEADASIPSSGVPCPGCGAEMHCQKSGTAGYIPADKYKEIPANKLRDHFCLRCNLMRHHDTALNASVEPEEYIRLLSQIKDVHALTLLIVDVTDLPNSLFRGLSSVIGRRRPLYIIGNKVDLLPNDGPGYLERIKDSLKDLCREEGLYESMYVHYVGLVSAKTGYGVESLITTLFSEWSRKGPVYLLGCTNAGKSTLFNSLLMSDYCKAGSREYMHRATTSLWPGTTLSLLKFPITSLEPGQIYSRVQRLIAERKHDHQQAALRKQQQQGVTATRKQQALRGNIGQTFSSRREERVKQAHSVVHGYDTATFSYDPRSGVVAATTRSREEVRREVKGERGEFDESRYEKSRWCYDTPGVINPEQIINRLTQEELSLVVHKSPIRPHFYVMNPAQVMFVSGLARLDYLQGPASVQLAVYAASALPVFVLERSEADQFYRENLGTPALGVPLGPTPRIQSLPALVGRDFVLTGCGQRESCGDVILSSTGWVAVTGGYNAEMRFRGYTPGGAGCVLREPGLLRHAARHRGKRIKGMQGTSAERSDTMCSI